MSTRTRGIAVALGLALATAGCSSGSNDTAAIASSTAVASTSSASGSAPSTTAPASSVSGSATSAPSVSTPPTTASSGPSVLGVTVRTGTPAPNGLAAPQSGTDPASVAAQIAAAERALSDTATVGSRRADAARLQQVAYRRLSVHPDWDAAVLAGLDPAVRAVAEQHVQARREFLGMRTTVVTTVPDWRIVDPEPADRLLGYYREAEAATGVPWSYLAAINLVESGLGRIHGLSVSGAQGPMQFLPSTWAERGIGSGDIDDPHDSIQAAARYLVRRGAPGNMTAALRGYNNHANYGRAVTIYAKLFAADERNFTAMWNWEIYYLSGSGDLWLPVGYEQPTRIAVSDYLRNAPWSAPSPGDVVPPLPHS